MSKKEIKIIVAGHADTGKSTIGMIVQSALEQCGIEAALFDIEEQSEAFTEQDAVIQRMEAIGEKTKVRIEIAQLPRASMES